MRSSSAAAADEHQQRRLDRQQHRFAQVVQARRIRRVRRGIERRDLGGGPLDVRFGLRERDARLASARS